MKNNIQSIDAGLDSILQLKPSTFYYNNEPNKRCAGFIAQDVLSILPLTIDTNKIREDDDTEYYFINSTSIIPYLVKAVQELSEKNTTLQNELVSQSSAIAALEARLAAAGL